MSYQTRVESPAPHKLLACDGGGIRGIISVEILAKIEAELRAASGNPTWSSPTILITSPEPAPAQSSPR